MCIKKVALLVSIITFIYSACTPTDKSGKVLDTPTSGEIKVAFDETFYPVMDSQVYTFESLYPEAHILAEYCTEQKAFELFNADSVRNMVCARELTKDELNAFKSKKIYPRTTPFATDALALIVHPDNTLDAMQYADLKDVFSGKYQRWDSLQPKSNLAELTIVFDRSGSSTYSYLSRKFLEGKPLPSNCFAANGSEAVIDYVSKNKNSLGVIGVNWISDSDDPTTQKFNEKIKVLALSPIDGNPLKPEYFKPYQAYIALKKYPLTRTLNYISREGRTGLGTGFSAFIAGDKGQRIILKSGLMPANAPVRIVGFR